MEKSFDTTHTAATGWTGDILGKDFERRTIVQPSDYDGPVCCTVVRLRPFPDAAPASRGVLYVHGFSDYFFQAEMARRFRDEGYAFYAVDLRKYGRSVLAGQKPFRVRDLREYFPDIEVALRQMADDGITSVVLLAHSTGGLICSLMMKECPPPQVAAMILNSPFLDWNLSSFQEKFLVPAVSTIGNAFPDIRIPQGGSSKYAESVLKQYGGEWDFNTQWKFIVSPDVDAGWIRAIDMGQGMLQNGEDIKIPILLMHSDRSYKKGDDDTQYAVTDAVLDVDDISKYGRRLGWDITEIKVNGGMHDLVLSKKNVREALYDYIFKWLDRQGL